MIIASIRKDCWLLLRDRGALLSLFLLPIVFILTFGLMFSGGGGEPGKGLPITSFQITVPGNAVLFGFYIALTVAVTFATERRTGTWRRLLAAPVPRSHALLATLVPYFLIGCAQLAFLFGLGAGVFGMEVRGSVLALVVLSLCVVLCAVCLGLLFAAFGGTERQLGAMGSVTLLVMGLLGGCMMPRVVMPVAMQKVGLTMPHAWALDGYYAALVEPSTTLMDVMPSIGALLGFSAIFAFAGLSLFKFER